MDFLASIPAEQTTLGALLIDNTALSRVDYLQATDFFDKRHRLIFTAIKNLIDNAKQGENAADCITVAENIIKSGSLKREEIAGYVINLHQNTPSAANITRYAKIVKDYSLKRQLADTCNKAIKGVYDTTAVVDDTLNNAQNALNEIVDNAYKSKKAANAIQNVLGEVIKDIQHAYNNKDELRGIDTGFYDLNKITHGLQKKDLIIIAGRPSMGKTAFAMNIAENAALKGASVLVYSMEMSEKQLVHRMIGSIGGISQTALISGNIGDNDWNKISDTTIKINELNILIDETAALTVTEIKQRSKQIARRQKIDLIVIDYLQLMSGENNKDENRVNELAVITRQLKALAKELDLPIMVLSQLNRDLAKRGDKRPLMSDLRDSGAIEQDADLIIMLHREEYYNKDDESLKGLAEALIVKNRNGATGTVNLRFIAECVSFRNLAH